MEEEISDREPRVKLKKEYNEVIPSGGIIIAHGKYGVCSYIDINDIPLFPEIIDQYRRSELPVGGSRHILKGSSIGEKYRFFAFHGAKLVGMYTYLEFLDNPHGYSSGDFFSDRYILPEYRQSLISRFVASDITHLLFHSGAAKRCYTYLKGKKDGEFLERNDQTSNPCLNLRYPIDGPNRQKHLSIKQEIPTENGLFLLWESNGDLYNKMDLEEYHLGMSEFISTDGGTLTKEDVKELISHQSIAAGSIKETMKMKKEKNGSINGGGVRLQ